MLQHRLFRPLGAVAFNAPQREAALIAQVSVGLPQPAVVGALEHGVVERPANALRFVDIERTAGIDPCYQRAQCRCRFVKRSAWAMAGRKERRHSL